LSQNEAILGVLESENKIDRYCSHIFWTLTHIQGLIISAAVPIWDGIKPEDEQHDFVAQKILSERNDINFFLNTPYTPMIPE